jgi:hypothetical protein
VVMAEYRRSPKRGRTHTDAGLIGRESFRRARKGLLETPRFYSARNCCRDHTLDGVGQGNVIATREVALADRMTVEVIEH